MRFLKPTAEAVKTARELGFEMSTATLQSEGLVGVFKRIADLPPDVIAKLFPNVRALRGVIPALKHMEGLEKDVAMMRKSAGATDTAYRKMTATLAHAFDRTKQAAVNVLRSIGEAIAEPLSRVSGALVKYAKLIADFISRNKSAVVAVAKVVLLIGAAGAALVALGVTIKLLAVPFGILAGIVSAAGTIIGLLGSVLGALLSPIGLVIAGVVALGAYILHATGLGAKAIAWLGSKFGELKAEAMGAWQGIADALAAGDIGMAAQILWLTLKMWWQKGVSWLTGIWQDFKYVIIRTLTEAFYGAVKGLAVVWATLQRAWVDVTSFIKSSWLDAVAGVRTGWEVTQTWLAKRFIELQGLLDDSLDVEDAKRGLEGKMTDALVKIEQERAGEQQKIDESREQRTRDIDSEEAGTLAELSKEAEAAKTKQLDEYADALGESESELAKAKQEWRDAVAAAAAKRKEKESGEPAPGGAGAPDLDELFRKLAGVGRAVEMGAKKTVGVRGTFSALEARGLGAGGVTDRVANATEKTVKELEELNGKADDGGLVFTGAE